MSDIVIDINQVSKLYSLQSVGTGTLTNDLKRWWAVNIAKKEDPFKLKGEINRRDTKGESDFVWALKDINLQIKKGEVVGIIGKNGSGKSTLLKILSRITTPTEGRIGTKGRIASLLEVNTGFHPEMSGRENIFMKGAILGMTKYEIKDKFDEIIDFAGIERFVDTPVKRYSSGMKVRLGFSVASFLRPEILLIDEVLAVGDVEFCKKAISKMSAITNEEGRTVLFVSHNMNSVLQLCNRGIVLEDGLMTFNGGIDEAVSHYMGNIEQTTHFEDVAHQDYPASLIKADVKSDSEIEGVFENTSPVFIEMEVDIRERIEDLIIGLNLFSQYGSPLARADYNDITLEKTLDPGRYLFTFEIPGKTLAPGNYAIALDVAKKRTRRYTNQDPVLFFEIVMGKEQFGNTYSIQTPTHISVIHPAWIKKKVCLKKY